MQIHVGRNGQQLGIFTPDQVRAAIATGQLRPDDIAWHEGLADWAPLGSLAALLAPPPEPAAAPEPAPKIARPGPATVAGARATAGSPWKKRLILWAVLLLLAGIAVPLFPTARSQLALVQHGKRLQSVAAACKLHATGHDGKYPAQLEDLVKENLLAAELLRCPFGVDSSPVGYHYYGAGLTVEEMKGKKAVLITKSTIGDGNRLVVYADDTVEMVRLPSLPPAK